METDLERTLSAAGYDGPAPPELRRLVERAIAGEAPDLADHIAAATTDTGRRADSRAADVLIAALAARWPACASLLEARALRRADSRTCLDWAAKRRRATLAEDKQQASAALTAAVVERLIALPELAPGVAIKVAELGPGLPPGAGGVLRELGFVYRRDNAAGRRWITPDPLPPRLLPPASATALHSPTAPLPPT